MLIENNIYTFISSSIKVCNKSIQSDLGSFQCGGCGRVFTTRILVVGVPMYLTLVAIWTPQPTVDVNGRRATFVYRKTKVMSVLDITMIYSES